MLSINQPLSKFSLLGSDGKTYTNQDFFGQTWILYFYPKDDTPGCTKEACSFRDQFVEYKKRGVKVVGVSPQGPKDHQKFIEKHSLPFLLLCDEKHELARACGVWGKKKFMGREYEGILRTTFVVGPDGKIIKVFPDVKPEGHAEEILVSLSSRTSVSARPSLDG